ncbi:MAG: tRNA (N6-isopentenyl adenosine(37)-C2)-methylthiotransferase MiaB [Firmicutes bacterium]|nr:tRNA (N6-isopentenyl adenosine(37)-C2)-methylthiotransferase MiaB [Bacillota bacterium]
MKTFYIKTYGCQMNVHESQKIHKLLESEGYIQAESEDKTDIIIFNTCTVRNTAEEKITSHIGNAHKEKRDGRNLILAIVGCLSQRDGVSKSLMKKFPQLDIILGTHNISEIGAAIENASRKQKTIEIVKERKLNPRFDNLTAPDDPTKPNTHYINITYGCDNYCTYCIVPYVRGRVVNREITEIESEFIKLFNSIKDREESQIIYLLGQNVNSYICPKTNKNFIGLLEQLSGYIKNSNSKLNFLSSHPKDFSRELADFIASAPEIERNIHLPIQNGCDKILKLMNRGYTVEDYKSKINYLRKVCPDVKITTDIICGFPGESEDDFADTINMVRDIKFNAAFIFPYSRRSGTAADKMSNQIDHKTKKARTTELIKIQREISNQITLGE